MSYSNYQLNQRINNLQNQINNLGPSGSQNIDEVLQVGNTSETNIIFDNSSINLHTNIDDITITAKNVSNGILTATWDDILVGSSGTVPNLQQVCNVGFETNTMIKLDDGYSYNEITTNSINLSIGGTYPNIYAELNLYCDNGKGNSIDSKFYNGTTEYSFLLNKNSLEFYNSDANSVNSVFSNEKLEISNRDNNNKKATLTKDNLILHTNSNDITITANDVSNGRITTDWNTILTGSGGTQNLQQVCDVGSSTNTQIDLTFGNATGIVRGGQLKVSSQTGNSATIEPESIALYNIGSSLTTTITPLYVSSGGLLKNWSSILSSSIPTLEQVLGAGNSSVSVMSFTSGANTTSYNGSGVNSSNSADNYWANLSAYGFVAMNTNNNDRMVLYPNSLTLTNFLTGNPTTITQNDVLYNGITKSWSDILNPPVPPPPTIPTLQEVLTSSNTATSSLIISDNGSSTLSDTGLSVVSNGIETTSITSLGLTYSNTTSGVNSSLNAGTLSIKNLDTGKGTQLTELNLTVGIEENQNQVVITKDSILAKNTNTSNEALLKIEGLTIGNTTYSNIAKDTISLVSPTVSSNITVNSLNFCNSVSPGQFSLNYNGSQVISCLGSTYLFNGTANNAINATNANFSTTSGTATSATSSGFSTTSGVSNNSNITDTNDSATFYLPMFSGAIATGITTVKQLFCDSTTGPLSYVPSTSLLTTSLIALQTSAPSVSYNNTTGALSITTLSCTFQDFNWTIPAGQATVNVVSFTISTKRNNSMNRIYIINNSATSFQFPTIITSGTQTNRVGWTSAQTIGAGTSWMLTATNAGSNGGNFVFLDLKQYF